METKSLNSVALMRELRDSLSREMIGMTSAERIRHVRNLAAATSLGTRLQKHAEQYAADARTGEMTRTSTANPRGTM